MDKPAISQMNLEKPDQNPNHAQIQFSISEYSTVLWGGSHNGSFPNFPIYHSS